MNETVFPPIPVLKAGLGSRCPRCGAGRLFAGLLEVPLERRSPSSSCCRGDGGPE
ncbi:MAG: hypothetical protein ACE5LL_04060 [Alphaproteobacteria bacterium]